MLIFREVEEMVSEVKGRIALLGSEEDATLDKRRLALLMQLVSYVNGMEWLSHAKLAAKVRVFLRSRFNYRQVAAEFGVSVKQAHKSISYAGDTLRNHIGGVCELIRSGDLVAAERELGVTTGMVDVSSLFVRGIMGRFQPTKCAGVVLSECRKELSFLSLFSSRVFDGLVASLSEEKMGHLMYIFSSVDTTYLREKGLIWSCVVDGSVSVDDCIRALNDEFIFGSPSDGSGF